MICRQLPQGEAGRGRTENLRKRCRLEVFSSLELPEKTKKDRLLLLIIRKIYWHNSDGERTLIQYMGMTWNEF